MIIVIDTTETFTDLRLVSSASEKVRAIRRITGNESLGTLPSIDLSAELGKFREYLAGRIKELSGKVVGTEKIGVDALVARSLLRRKPFDGEEIGRAHV